MFGKDRGEGVSRLYRAWFQLLLKVHGKRIIPTPGEIILVYHELFIFALLK